MSRFKESLKEVGDHVKSLWPMEPGYTFATMRIAKRSKDKTKQIVKIL